MEGLRTELRAAQDEDDFDRLSELAKSAKAKKAAIGEAEKLWTRQKDVIRRILDGGIADIDDLPPDMRVDEALEDDEESLHAMRDLLRSNVVDDGGDLPDEDEPEESATDMVEDTPAASLATTLDDSADYAAITGGASDEPAAEAADTLEETAPTPAGGDDTTGEIAQDLEDDVSKDAFAIATEAAEGGVANPASAEESPAAEMMQEDQPADAPTAEMESSALEDPEHGTAEEGSAHLFPDTPAAPDRTSAPAGVAVLADLVSRDIIGIAADAAEAFEAEGSAWPIKAAVLRVAAGARAPHREHGLETQRFLAIANRAISAETDDLGSVLLLGASHPAGDYGADLPSPPPRRPLRSLPRQSRAAPAAGGGGHRESRLRLFPPGADELAEFSGTQRVPFKQRLEQQLAEWCDTCSQRTSRWHFATSFMHNVVSEQGLIGAARAAIEKGAPDAAEKARKAISDLSPSEIGDRSTEFAKLTCRTSSRLHPRGIGYLNQQFGQPLGLLDSWVRATERVGGHGQRSAARLQATVGNLVTRLDKAPPRPLVSRGARRQTR